MNNTQQNDSNDTKEIWEIQADERRFIFRRILNGMVIESYSPVGRDVATIYAAAIINGFEPPRQLIEICDGIISHQARHPDSDSQ